MTAPDLPPEIHTDGLEELAGLIHFQAGAWEDFGYRNPPGPDCKTIPPLGERSAQAIRAGHEAIANIDLLIGRLRAARAELVTQLRQDEDVRAARLPGREVPGAEG